MTYRQFVLLIMDKEQGIIRTEEQNKQKIINFKNIMNEKVITISSYGLCLFSNERLKQFLKEYKVKSRKILKYFQDNKDIYLQSIEKGIWLPILPIDSINYVIKNQNNGEIFDENWIKINQNNGFNIEIGNDNKLWIVDKDM